MSAPPPPPKARWSVSNRRVTHDSLSSPERAVTMRGSYRKTWGGHCSQPPHLGGGGQDRKGPAQDRRPAWSWHEGPSPADHTTALFRACGPPPALPEALTDPPPTPPTGPGSFCSDNRSTEKGKAGRSCLARASQAQHQAGARGPSRPAHPSDPISGRGPGMHLGFTMHGPQPKTGSWESSPDEKGRINCPPVSVIPAVGCLLESSLEQKETSAQGSSSPWHPRIPQGQPS